MLSVVKTADIFRNDAKIGESIVIGGWDCFSAELFRDFIDIGESRMSDTVRIPVGLVPDLLSVFDYWKRQRRGYYRIRSNAGMYVMHHLLYIHDLKGRKIKTIELKDKEFRRVPVRQKLFKDHSKCYTNGYYTGESLKIGDMECNLQDDEIALTRKRMTLYITTQFIGHVLAFIRFWKGRRESYGKR
jgi:hypothetical protein